MINKKKNGKKFQIISERKYQYTKTYATFNQNLTGFKVLPDIFSALCAKVLKKERKSHQNWKRKEEARTRQLLLKQGLQGRRFDNT